MINLRWFIKSKWESTRDKFIYHIIYKI
jgi:hypothetical protein